MVLTSSRQIRIIREAAASKIGARYQKSVQGIRKNHMFMPPTFSDLGVEFCT